MYFGLVFPVSVNFHVPPVDCPCEADMAMFACAAVPVKTYFPLEAASVAVLLEYDAEVTDVATSATSFTLAESARDVVVPFCVPPFCVGPEGESLPFEQETKAPAKSADAAKRPKISREIFFTINLQRCVPLLYI
jgi:hypothetical protein